MNDIVRPDFDNMPIAKLREYARHMNIALAKTAKAEEIKEAIIRKLAGRSSAVIAEQELRFHPAMPRLLSTKTPLPVLRIIQCISISMDINAPSLAARK